MAEKLDDPDSPLLGSLAQFPAVRSAGAAMAASRPSEAVYAYLQLSPGRR